METKRRLTAKEFFETYQEESRLELIDGEVYEMPAPSVNHQRLVGNLYLKLRNFLREGVGEVFFSPVDVVLTKKTFYNLTLFMCLTLQR